MRIVSKSELVLTGAFALVVVAYFASWWLFFGGPPIKSSSELLIDSGRCAEVVISQPQSLVNSSSGRSTAEYALLHGQPACFERLALHTDRAYAMRENWLNIAITMRDDKATVFCLDHSLWPHSSKQESPVLWAVRSRYLRGLIELKKRNFSFNERGFEGLTPLQLSRRLGSWPEGEHFLRSLTP